MRDGGRNGPRSRKLSTGKACRRSTVPPATACGADILNHNGQVDLTRQCSLSGLSQRQFERKFSDQVGMPAKIYARINRFSYAMKRGAPVLELDRHHLRGRLFDQTHLVKDFRSLAGDTPSRFLNMLTSAPDVVLQHSLDELG